MPNEPTEWTVESLSLLLIRNGCSRYLAGRHGPNLFVEMPPTPTPDRPGAPQHPITPCLVWRFGKNNDGYGTIWVDGGKDSVHIRVYELATGAEVPKGMTLAHSCEVRACARPDHVSPSTHQDNLKESANRVYPDEVLALAVEPGPCPRCGASGRTPSPWRHNNGTWFWRWTCGPCHAAFRRGENIDGRYRDGQQRLTMPPEHSAVVLRYAKPRTPRVA